MTRIVVRVGTSSADTMSRFAAERGLPTYTILPSRWTPTDLVGVERLPSGAVHVY